LNLEKEGIEESRKVAPSLVEKKGGEGKFPQ
jgi:hypothetical protein